MVNDYFGVLQLKRNAQEQEVITAFKKLALKYHPLKNSEQMRMYLPMFHEICEAYEVLSNQQLRTIYEQYGEEVLHSGVIGPDGVRRGGYVYQQNCYEIFEKFFLEQNPFSEIIDTKGTQIEGSYFGTAFGGLNEIEPPVKPMPDCLVTLTCTLKDFYCGVRKQVSYDRQVVGLDGRTVKQETTTVDVFVRAGMSVGSQLSCPGKGNETPRRAPSDLIVKLEQEENASCPYSRVNSNDLVYTHSTTLVDCLRCLPFEVVTFDNRKLVVSPDNTASPAFAKVVESEGMPIYGGLEGGSGRGNLYIKFDVSFPKNISTTQKAQIIALFSSS